MNSALLHLAANHFPLMGAFFGMVVLVLGYSFRSDQTKITAYFVFIISVIGGGISYLSGPAAADAVKNLPGIVKEDIGEHAGAAFFALVAYIILGVLSVIGIIFTIKKNAMAGKFSVVILVAALLCFLIAARTSYLGGHISHPEIKPDSESTFLDIGDIDIREEPIDGDFDDEFE